MSVLHVCCLCKWLLWHTNGNSLEWYQQQLEDQCAVKSHETREISVSFSSRFTAALMCNRLQSGCVVCRDLISQSVFVCVCACACACVSEPTCTAGGGLVTSKAHTVHSQACSPFSSHSLTLSTDLYLVRSPSTLPQSLSVTSTVSPACATEQPISESSLSSNSMCPSASLHLSQFTSRVSPHVALLPVGHWLSPKSLTTPYIMHYIVTTPFCSAVQMSSGKYYTLYSALKVSHNASRTVVYNQRSLTKQYLPSRIALRTNAWRFQFTFQLLDGGDVINGAAVVSESAFFFLPMSSLYSFLTGFLKLNWK